MPIKVLIVEGGSVSIHVLERPANFLPWLRDIRSVSLRLGVWELMNGKEEILKRKAEQPANRTMADDTKAYDWCRQDIEKQQARIMTASLILIESVHDSIQNDIAEYKTPAKAFEYLRSKYEPNKARSLILALSKMEAITLRTGTTITEFANLLRNARNEVVAAGGTYDNVCMVAKLSRSLSKAYDDFVFNNIDLADKIPDFNTVVTSLMAFDIQLAVRNSNDEIRQKPGSDRHKQTVFG